MEPGLLSLNLKEMSFPVAFLDRTMVNMTSCCEVEEDTDQEGGNKENCSGETDKTVVALEVMANWGHIFSLPDETRQHMVVALHN